MDMCQRVTGDRDRHTGPGTGTGALGPVPGGGCSVMQFWTGAGTGTGWWLLGHAILEPRRAGAGVPFFIVPFFFVPLVSVPVSRSPCTA